MGKLDDVKGLEAPVGRSGQDSLAKLQSEAFRFVNHCKVLELDPKFVWAYDTISGIRATVETTGRVTEGQRRAVRNIEVGQERRQSGQEDRGYRRRPGGSRRYEGW